MITGVFASFFPERLTPWLFGIEAAAAVFVAAMFWSGTLGGGLWPALGFVWYTTYCALLYFHWVRRQTLKKDETWAPTLLAKLTAILCFASLVALGGGIAYWWSGSSIQVVVIGLVIMAIGILQLIGIVKRGWPRLGF